MTAKFTLHFEADNAAFDYGQQAYETARILRDVANRIESGNVLDVNLIKDVYGNLIGTFSIQKDGHISVVTI